MKRLAFLVCTILLLASGVASASDAPILSERRLSLGAGVNYEFANNAFGGSEPVLDRKQEFVAGLYAAYNLTPHLSVVGSSVVGVSSLQLRSSVGLRLRLWNGERDR